MTIKVVLAVITLVGVVTDAQPSALDTLHDIYVTCLQNLSVGCVQPKALAWMNNVGSQPVIKVTDDLLIVKKSDPENIEEQRSSDADIFDKFEDFLQTHDVVAKVPGILQPNGPLGSYIPRSFQPTDLTVPLAATGRRSKLVKKVLVPFLLGLKFKTAVLVPLALALIALKTWKALTLGLLSLVLTGALIIFKSFKSKVSTYEVIHYPQHVEHHVEHPHPPHGWEHTAYGRELSSQDLAYNAYSKK